MQQLEIRQTNLANTAAERVPEAQYTYYRRCQLFLRNGDQCKAPAEKGEAICHAHAAQKAMAVRRERERRAVLAEAVAEMRRQGRPECEMADLLTDFKGIQITLAVVAKALIDSRIDCKTAGRLLVHLQTMSKLLWLAHRKGREGRKENRVVPQICADERRSYKVGDSPEQKQELLTVKDTKEHQGLAELRIVKEWEQSGSANRTRNAEIIVIRRTGGAGTYVERVHGPPDVVRAA
jgi:hypothetical protein